MRSRLVLVLVGTTFAVIALFGIPRAFVLAGNVHEQEQARLDHSADLVAEVLVERHRSGSPITASFLAGLLADGEGLVLTRDSESTTVGTPGDGDGDIVEVREVDDVGRIELMRSGSQVNGMVTDAILPLATLGLVLLLASALVGIALARRLSRPFQELAVAAEQLGHGRFDVDVAHYAVPEAEMIGGAIRGAASRLDGLISHERELAVNASHQLRTPIAGLRLRLEDLSLWPQTTPELAEQLAASVADVDRLAAAVDDLLDSERRHRSEAASDVDLHALAEESVKKWTSRVEAAGRRIELADGGPVTARVEAETIDAVLDLLLDNALHHGTGRIQLDATELESHLRVRVADEGRRSLGSDLLHGSPELVAEGARGLARAAELVESVGGYLRVDETEHTRMVLMLPKSSRS